MAAVSSGSPKGPRQRMLIRKARASSTLHRVPYSSRSRNVRNTAARDAEAGCRPPHPLGWKAQER